MATEMTVISRIWAMVIFDITKWPLIQKILDQNHFVKRTVFWTTMTVIIEIAVIIKVTDIFKITGCPYQNDRWIAVIIKVTDIFKITGCPYQNDRCMVKLTVLWPKWPLYNQHDRYLESKWPLFENTTKVSFIDQNQKNNSHFGFEIFTQTLILKLSQP